MDLAQRLSFDFHVRFCKPDATDPSIEAEHPPPPPTFLTLLLNDATAGKLQELRQTHLPGLLSYGIGEGPKLSLLFSMREFLSVLITIDQLRSLCDAFETRVFSLLMDAQLVTSREDFNTHVDVRFTNAHEGAVMHLTQSDDTITSVSTASAAAACSGTGETKDVPTCSVCTCPYTCQVSHAIDRMPRCLPCGHSACTVCISKLMTQGVVQCPHTGCRKKYIVRKSSESTLPSDLARQLPIDSTLVSKMATPVSQETSSAHHSLCEFVECKAPAAHVCFTCAGLTQFCAEHDRVLHVHFPTHKRNAIQDKQTVAAHRFSAMIAPVAEARRQELRAAALVSHNVSVADAAKVTTLQAALHDAQAALTAAQEVAATSKAAANEMAAQVTRAEYRSDMDLLAETVLRQALMPGLLSALTSEEQQHLRRLLPDVTLSKLRLLYRGSEHGNTPEAVWERCDGQAACLLGQQQSDSFPRRSVAAHGSRVTCECLWSPVSSAAQRSFPGRYSLSQTLWSGLWRGMRCLDLEQQQGRMQLLSAFVCTG
jgi:hypothetical protein